MAATSIWPVNGDIGHLLRYTQDPGKTDGSLLVSGVNCAPNLSMDEMNLVKRQFGKTGGIVAFHGYQSFAPGEVTPEIAHQIGIRLATELWGDRFQVVVSTHVDKEHIHNHFAINSVSFADGKRFHSGAKDLYRLREVSDRLCREYGLSVIESPKQGGTKNHAEYTAEKQGQSTWRSLIQSDIDQAIAASMTERQFFLALQQMGYAYKIGKDISVRPPGKERYFRLERNLGSAYSLPEIRKRLGRSPPPKAPASAQPLPVRKHYRMKGTMPQKQKSHFRRMYLYYCYRLGVFPKYPQSTAKMHFLLREDLRNLDKYTQEIKLLHTYQIDTAVQLSAFQEEKQASMDCLTQRRQKLRNRLRHMTDAIQQEPIKQQISDLTKQITAIRKEVKLCNDIAAHAKEIPEKLRRIQRDAQRKEELQHGHQRTGR